jgi:transposase
MGGDVFIFINRNRIKLLHWEPGGMVIYSKMLEEGTFSLPSSASPDTPSYSMQWRDLVLLVEGIMEKPDSRNKHLEYLKNIRKSV